LLQISFSASRHPFQFATKIIKNKIKRMGACIETVADKELGIKTLENNTLHSHKRNTSCKKYKNNGDGVS